MRRCAFRLLGVPAGMLLLGIQLSGQTVVQNSPPADVDKKLSHLGYPQDWSSRHLLMAGVRPEDAMTAGARDPRLIYNQVMRQIAAENGRAGAQQRRRRMKIDWAVSLGNAYVPEDQYPAKYQFSIGQENCDSDYALFALTVVTGTQANLVGINNLYTQATPPCNSGAPWVAFAYNTVTQLGGQIVTSPELSEDGTKVAFVESTLTGSYFHVLVLPNPIPSPPSQDGTVASPLTPTSCSTPTAPGCMTTLAIETTATNSNSSPWVDYSADTAYVGANNGLLYKITPVFGGGAPALVTNSDWPVTVSTNTGNKILTAPVEDTNSGRLFLGDGEGYFYAVSLNSPGGTYSAEVTIGWTTHGPGTGIIDAPDVVYDASNPTVDQVFVFTGCSNVLGIGGAITQLPTNFTSATAISTANTVNLGSATGTGDCTTGNVHAGTLDNAFWVNGSASGHMIACGFVSGTTSHPLIPSNPQMYFFPFASNVITSTGSSTFVVNSTIGDECSPLTEFYDGTTDRLFFGVGLTDGFLESSVITNSLSSPVCTSPPTSSCVTAPAALGGTSGIIIDNQVTSDGGANLYFSTLAPGSVNGQQCNGPDVRIGASSPYCAVKLTQLALQ
jgi:hypothetical protein